MELLSSLAAVVVPVFLCSAIGYAWVRRGLGFDHQFVTDMVTLLGAPCLIFLTLVKMRFAAADLLQVGGATLACLVVTGALAAVTLKLARLPLGVYLPSLTFPNIGNMGLPVCLFAFGERGLGMAMIVFTVTSVGQLTFGPAVAARNLDLKRLAKVPFLYVAALALVLGSLGVRLPAWGENTLTLLSGVTIPLMLMALGAALAGFKVASLKRQVALSVFRLVVGGGVGWAVATLFGLDGVAKGVLIIQNGMPVAVFNYLFARMYDNSPEEVAGMVLVSTTLSYLTLPLVVALVM